MQSKSSNVVMVGCKLPHGLTISLYELATGEDGKPVMRKVGESVTLNGANAKDEVFGYGITEVDADFWDAWSKQNQAFPAVKNGLIFSQPNQARATDQAKDQQAAKTGVERIDPDKPGKGIERVPEADLKAAAAMAA